MPTHKKAEPDLLILNKKLEERITGLELRLRERSEELKLAKSSKKTAIAVTDSESKITSDKLDRLTRQNTFINHINQDILRAADQKTLFFNACRIALEFGKFEVTWIGLFDKTRKKIIPIEQSGTTDNDLLQTGFIEIKSGGPEEYVLSNNTYYICNTIEDSLNLGNWTSFAAKRGILSAMVLPIKKSGKIIGTFNLYSQKLDFAEKDEIELLAKATKDISFALDALENVKNQYKIEKLLSLNENRFRALIENNKDLITLSKKNGEMLYYSPAITRVFGYTIEEMEHTGNFDLFHPDDLPEFEKKRKRIIRNPGESFSSRQRLKHKDGHWIWCDVTVTNLLNESGLNAIVSNFRDISEKVNTNIQKEFGRKNFNALINSTSNLMWSVDRNFKLITSNKPFDDMLKKATGKPLSIGGNVLSAGVSTQTLIRYKRFYERAFKGEIFTELDYAGFPEESWSEISFYPIREGDEIIGTACYLQDITQRKKAGEQIKKSEKFTREILNSLSSHIAVINVKGIIVTVNDSWKQFTKENSTSNLKGTAEGGDYFEVCKNSAKAGVIVAGEVLIGIKEVIAQKRDDYYVEYPCDSPTENRWFSLTVRKLDSDEPMIVLAHQNISERKLTEKKLLQSETSLNEAQAISHTGNWEFDFDKNIHTWSDEMFNIFGIKRTVVQPSTDLFLSFIHPEDLEDIKTEVDEAYKNLNATSYTFRFIRADGKIRYGSTERRFELDQNNKPKRLLGVVQDISERKLAEEERDKMVADIIQRSKDQEQFSYIISHNLRAPIANVLGLANLLNGKISDQEKSKIQKFIFTAVVKLDEIIKDLNKILEMKFKISENKEMVNLSKLVTDIKLSIPSLLAKDTVFIRTNFLDVSMIKTLKSYLQSIFYNLISNSIKYKQPGKKMILIITSERQQDKVRITFKDNGMGMDLKQYGDKLFGLYKRFHQDVEGKGLGLFMVKTQVEVLGGSIKVLSEPNMGAEFIIELPV